MEGRGGGEERVERIGKEQIKEWKCEKGRLRGRLKERKCGIRN